jgi:hypothetical protein
LVRIANEATDQLNVLLSPDLFAVDFLPILCHIPEWFPGGGFHKIACEWRQSLFDLTDKSYEFVLDQMVRLSPSDLLFGPVMSLFHVLILLVQAKGTAVPIFVMNLLEGRTLLSRWRKLWRLLRSTSFTALTLRTQKARSFKQRNASPRRSSGTWATQTQFTFFVKSTKRTSTMFKCVLLPLLTLFLLRDG